MSKDGMSRDGRKMSPMHVTLKAGVNGINLENVIHIIVIMLYMLYKVPLEWWIQKSLH